MLLRKPQHRKLSSIVCDMEDECMSSKLNEFSDKKFYEQNIKEKYKLHRWPCRMADIYKYFSSVLFILLYSI